MIEKFKKDVSLKEHTTFKIGGAAKYFFTANTSEDIINAIKWAKKENVPFFVLGGGSNLLVSDNGFDGLVIKTKNEEYNIESCNEDFTVCITAGAGVWINKLIKLCIEEGLSGLEWAAGIPGITVAGAVVESAGGFGKRMVDVVLEIEVFDSELSEVKKLRAEDCGFGYKESIFKKNSNLIILSVKMALKKKNKKNVKNEITKVLKYRSQNHPALPSAGCVFKNPNDNKSAGLLIKDAGLSGKTVGAAQISDKHSNFIVNLGNASSGDVLELIQLVKEKVKEKFGIELEEEVRYLGF